MLISENISIWWWWYLIDQVSLKSISLDDFLVKGDNVFPKAEKTDYKILRLLLHMFSDDKNETNFEIA